MSPPKSDVQGDAQIYLQKMFLKVKPPSIPHIAETTFLISGFNFAFLQAFLQKEFHQIPKSNFHLLTLF